MFNAKAAFAGFSVDDLGKAKQFYTETLGLKIHSEEMGISFQLPGGGGLFVYPKPNHEPATYTVLNFVVEDIDQAVDELTSLGVQFEHYDMGEIKTDDKGIARSPSADKGPDIAWFKDPAGNILSVLQNK